MTEHVVIRTLPLIQRQPMLKRLLGRKRSRILYLDHIHNDPLPLLFALLCLRLHPIMRPLATCILVLAATVFALGVQRPQPNPVGKWQPAELIRPQDLIIKIRDNGPQKPMIIFAGFMPTYRAGHIPGAVFGGPASSAAGLDTLKSAVEKVPKNREIVIYC